MPSYTSPNLSSQQNQYHESSNKPHILIVGGGIGGLTLAILLQHAHIPYTVLERSSNVRLLGSAIALGPGVLPLFEQVGLLEEIEQSSRPVTRGMVWSEKLIPIMDLDHTSTQKRYGSLTRVIARPTLYQILLSHVPSEKLFMGKKVISFTQQHQHRSATAGGPSVESTGYKQQQHPIVIQCADGSQFSGDILVGADGAYSITRRLLYQQIENDYIASVSGQVNIPPSSSLPSPLPACDKELLSFTSTCLVGQTRPGLDLSKFKYVRGPDCKVGSIIGDHKPYSWSVFSMPDDSICWMVTEHLGESFSAVSPASSVPSLSSPSPRSASPAPSASSTCSKSDEASSEWGPLQVDIMCEQVKDFPIPCGPGLKMSDLIQNTDRDKISKVMLEEKLFETWSYGRVVLLGDACHKMHPSAGLGAVAAIQDAAILSDLLYQLPESPSLQDIQQVFEIYREDRYCMAQQSYETSYQMSTLNEQSWISNFIRKVMNNLPKWIWYRVLDRMYEYRPQVSFLPRVQDRGEMPPLPPSYTTYSNGFDIDID
ncbi:hypothetical protein BX616_006419 [Lobosporangium transversale]|uniref:FAD-binding domain-containing protein n=1 Tax=Lobosporangium transversale TaxID=64571 RepID=A0A1Y2G9D4_9FUNG|nr:hypothetical protein BCR41DRAFT_363205 [Lobosporangium transversale]KAF9918713.1 hypothetical protein BX616_006419 [Lobosporangium transversale]ORZ02019.1 hypothetical protein BCR41DRAFT_363205 [Lobosporangium transversale]|eukprot:XP_021876247.1 hypothetical protein BCR41DRAFT_363205 [Lobosporangium transversale]